MAVRLTIPRFNASTIQRILLPLGVALLLAGCACPRPASHSGRRFDFQQDTFAYPNELLWIYHYDAAGKWVYETRHPRPKYWLHCFVVARCAKQFFLNARFEPGLRTTTDHSYRKLIRRVAHSSPRCPLPESQKIIIPGYNNLREFSAAHEDLLKRECGRAWQSYLQRGHWRMVFPFTRRHQQRTAELLFEDISNQPLVVHLVRFPQLTINHAVVLFDAKRIGEDIQFSAYDPNDPTRSTKLRYRSAQRIFEFPANHYFPGGPVNVYEIYKGALF